LSIEYLGSLPEVTFGKKYWNFLSKNVSAVKLNLMKFISLTYFHLLIYHGMGDLRRPYYVSHVSDLLLIYHGMGDLRRPYYVSHVSDLLLIYHGMGDLRRPYYVSHVSDPLS
jgi:hypothetical protein